MGCIKQVKFHSKFPVNLLTSFADLCNGKFDLDAPMLKNTAPPGRLKMSRTSLINLANVHCVILTS